MNDFLFGCSVSQHMCCAKLRLGMCTETKFRINLQVRR